VSTPTWLSVVWSSPPCCCPLGSPHPTGHREDTGVLPNVDGSSPVFFLSDRSVLGLPGITLATVSLTWQSKPHPSPPPLRPLSILCQGGLFAAGHCHPIVRAQCCAVQCLRLPGLENYPVTPSHLYCSPHGPQGPAVLVKGFPEEESMSCGRDGVSFPFLVQKLPAGQGRLREDVCVLAMDGVSSEVCGCQVSDASTQ
jgi:hypothetical protein